MPLGAELSETTRLLRDLVALPSVNPMGRPLHGPTSLRASRHRLPRRVLPRPRRAAASGRPSRRCATTSSPAASRPAPRQTLVLRGPPGHGADRQHDHRSVRRAHRERPALRPRRLRHQGRHGGDAGGVRPAGPRASRRGAANVVMACTVDEEHTFLGVQRLVSTGLQAPTWPSSPSRPSCNIVNAHKGVVPLAPDHDGPVLPQLRGRSRASTPSTAWAGCCRPSSSTPSSCGDSRRDPLLGPPTLSVGRIEGGTSVNTVPDRCRIEIDRRLIPGEDARGRAARS